MSRHEKASYLSNTFQAKSYAHGMKLADAQKPFIPPACFVPTQKKEPFWWQKNDNLF